MPHVLTNDSPGCRRIKDVPVRKALAGQVIGSMARLRRRDVGERVAREDHQVRVGLVDPESELRAVVRIAELDAGPAVVVRVRGR